MDGELGIGDDDRHGLQGRARPRAGRSLWIDLEGNATTCQCAEHPESNPCAFEYVYFARPDSTIDGINVYGARLRLGEYLAETVKEKLDLSEIDVVMPIPDSSRPCAQELAARLNLSYREGFIKNRYVAAPSSCQPGHPQEERSSEAQCDARPNSKGKKRASSSMTRSCAARQ